MIKFEKVSYGQFAKDTKKLFGEKYSDKEIKEAYDKIELPKRGTSGSAGYDFHSPFDFTLLKEETYTIPTGICCYMNSNIVLEIYPRSGLGFKTGMRLANSTGVIDSDYKYSDNEGHIMAKFVGGFKDLEVKAGDRVAQGVFLQYFTTDDDEAKEIRNGGFGSTGTSSLSNSKTERKEK